MADLHNRVFTKVRVREMRISGPLNSSTVVRFDLTYSGEGCPTVETSSSVILDEEESREFYRCSSFDDMELFLLGKINLPVGLPSSEEPRQATRQIIGIGG